MPLYITCPVCGRRLDIPNDASGEPYRCPGCSHPFTPASPQELDKCGIQSDAAARSPTTPLADDDEIPLTLISADIEEAESGDSGVQRHKKPDDSGPREPEKEPEVVELANRPRKKKKKQRRKSLILVVC